MAGALGGWLAVGVAWELLDTQLRWGVDCAGESALAWRVACCFAAVGEPISPPRLVVMDEVDGIGWAKAAASKENQQR